MPPPRSPDVEPVRQGFVGYINVEGLQWRVMVRLRLEDEAWGGGRLWFSEAGGAGGGGKEKIFGRRPAEVLRQGRGGAAARLGRGFPPPDSGPARHLHLRAV